MSEKNRFIDDETFSVDEIMAEIKALDMNSGADDLSRQKIKTLSEPKAPVTQKPEPKSQAIESKRPEIREPAPAPVPPPPRKKPIKFEIPQAEKARDDEPKKIKKRTKEIDYGVEIEDAPREHLPYDFIFEPDEYDMGANTQAIGKKIKKLSGSIGVSLALLIIAFVVTALPSLPIALPSIFMFENVGWIYCIVLSSALIIACLCALDVFKAGLAHLFRLSPTLDTLIAVASIVCAIYSATCIISADSLPYTLAPQIMLFASLVEKRGRLRMLRRTYKAAMISVAPIHIRTDFDDDKRTIVKREGQAQSGADVIAQSNTMHKYAKIFSPISLVVCIALAGMASFGQGNGADFLRSFAIIMCASAPIGLALAVVSPGLRITKKLFTSGTALFSSDCARELAQAKYIAVADCDVFPQGSVSISGMKIEKHHIMENVVSRAASLIGCIDGGVGFAFLDFAKQQYISVPQPNEVEYHEQGGMSAVIGGDKVLCGTAAFLMRRGIHVSEGLSIKSGVFVAINLSFAGVFALKYGALPQTYSAFRVIKNSGTVPVLASRDFNATPRMTEGKFGLRAGKMEYPPIDERLRLASGDANGKHRTLALLSRNTMISFAECCTAAKKLCTAVTLNIVLSSIAAACGILLLYFLTSTQNFAAASPINVALYVLLWHIPTWVFSAMSAKY